jgi:hypothetical protein
MLRLVRLLPVIRANIEIFATAIAKAASGTARMGKTLGTPLACAYALESDEVITDEIAVDFIRRTDWMADVISEARVAPDWEMAIGRLVQHRVEVISDNGLREQAPLGELMDTAVKSTQIRAPVKTALNRAGIRIDGTGRAMTFSILNRSTELGKCFMGTPWAASWAKTIERVPSAKKPVGNVYVPGHTPGRATVFPASAFVPEEASA